MKNSLITLLMTVSVLIGYSQQTNESLMSDGETREYILYKPSGFDPQTETLPLVIVMHGLGGNNSQMTTLGFNQIADTARFIVAYPMGFSNSFGQNSWNNGTALSSSVNDVNFISQIIDKTNQDVTIDLTRVYVCGLSMGGIMSFRISLQLNNRIAAMASMVGTMSTPDKQSGVPTNPVPMMQWHGTNDGTVPYNSGALPTLELVQPTLDFWKDADKCGESDSTIYTIPDVMSDGITVERIVYHASSPGCDSVEMEHWKFTNGDHTWYNGFQNDCDGAKEFWLFFRDKSMSNPAPVGIENETTINFNLFPNPSRGQLNITSDVIIDDVKIYNSTGQLIHQEGTNATSIQLSLDLTPGIYTVAVKSGNKFHSQPVIIK